MSSCEVKNESQPVVDNSFSTPSPSVTESLAPSAPSPDAPFREHRLRYDGFGPVKVGMTLEQAQTALGVEFKLYDDYEGGCNYAEPLAGDPERTPGFMVNDGTIARIDISKPEYQTDKGAKVGDSEERIKQLYGEAVEIEQHFYIDGHYLTIKYEEGKYAMVFETDGSEVTYIRAGRMPEAWFVEGCS